MPITPTYPGVYIEEIPGVVRTITGVATSITAFIGRALRGPAEEPITLNSYADVERIFGGLWVDSALGYAVQDFYRNGGSQAIVVRLYAAETGAGAAPSNAELDANGLQLIAAYEGAWGNHLRARVDLDVSEDVATGFGLVKADLFNLTVRDIKTGVEEQCRNLTVKESPTRDKPTSRKAEWARKPNDPGQGAPLDQAEALTQCLHGRRVLAKRNSINYCRTWGAKFSRSSATEEVLPRSSRRSMIW